MELDTLLALIGVAAAAGFVDAIAGGGGLLTVPGLLLAGLSPAEAIATNKLQGTFGVASSSYAFVRAGYVDPKELLPAVGTTALGALIGSLCVSALDQALLQAGMPIILMAAAAYFAFAPELDGRPAGRQFSVMAFALGVAAPIGFYDGFFGPGAGSLYLLGFVMFAGCGLLQATASTKILNLTSNLMSLIVFIWAGKVVLAVGLPMALGQTAGAWLGARTAMVHGARLIRPVVVIVSVAVALRLFFEDGNPMGAWISTAWR